MSVFALGLLHPSDEVSLTLFEDPYAPRMSKRRRSIGRALLVLGLALIVPVAFMPSPYVIERPGPVINTLGETNGVPMVQISDATTYKTSGRLNLLTVSLVGSREQTPGWLEIAQAWLDPAQTILPVDEVYPANQTTQQSDAENAAMMVESQQDAVAAALIHLGHKVPRQLLVADVFSGTPASGLLKAQDQLLTAAGKPLASSVEKLRDIIQANGSKPLNLTLLRGGKLLGLTLSPYLDGKTYRLGILTTYRYTFPVQVKITAGDIGGPSGGLMFALAITDKLTPGQLTGGRNISGTGTIDAEGQVGPIGGIEQKMYGAARAGSTVFLAPSQNCSEVVGHVPAGLHVIKVSTLAGALDALTKLNQGVAIGSLPTCTK